MMNKFAVLHTPESRYAYPLDENTVRIILRTAKNDTFDKVTLAYGGKYDFIHRQKRVVMVKRFSDGLFDYYINDLFLDDIRLAYIFKFEEKGQIIYYCEDGFGDTYDFDEAYHNFFHFPFISRSDLIHPVDWAKSAVFYQIFVERFCRGDLEKDDQYINLTWGELPDPSSYAGGDIKGITEKLCYIDSLGINALYLTPVFAADSNHKYNIHDYYEIDKQFGSSQDLKDLINAAHEKGIRVVLDAVFNHASETTMQFLDVKKRGRKSEYFDWFIIDGDFPDSEKLNYQCFADCGYMPKWNTSNEQVQEFLTGVALHYIKEYDIDGWRIDVADELSHEMLRKLRTAVKSIKSDALLLGETWHDADAFLQGDQLDSIMNFPVGKVLLDYTAYKSISAQKAMHRLTRIYLRAKAQVNDMMLNFLDNHDTRRYMNIKNATTDSFLCALALLVFFPGMPCIYYGTEIAMDGGGDPDCRRTMDWSEAEKETVFKQKLKRVLSLKKDELLHCGELYLDAQNSLLIISRQENGQVIRVAVNMQKEERTVPLKGEILLSHNLCGEKLGFEGFIVSKETV